MKIRLTQNIPVGEEHGLTTGLELETCDPAKGSRDIGGIWVRAPWTGKEVRLWKHEYEEIK